MSHFGTGTMEQLLRLNPENEPCFLGIVERKPDGTYLMRTVNFDGPTAVQLSASEKARALRMMANGVEANAVLNGEIL